MEHSFVRPGYKPNHAQKSKTQTRGKAGQKLGSKKKSMHSPEGVVVLLPPRLFSQRVMRKFTYSTVLNSSAAGIIALTNFSAQDIVSGLGSEFSNFAQEFQQFRIRQMGGRFFPATTNATSTTGPYQGAMILAPWAQLRPSTANTVNQSDQLVQWSTLEEKEICVPSPNQGNFKLFNVTNVAMVVDRDYGISYFSLGTLAVSSAIFVVNWFIIVEFATPQ